METIKCPICGIGTLTERIYQGDVELYYSVCDVCGSETATPEQLKKNNKLMKKGK